VLLIKNSKKIYSQRLNPQLLFQLSSPKQASFSQKDLNKPFLCLPAKKTKVKFFTFFLDKKYKATNSTPNT